MKTYKLKAKMKFFDTSINRHRTPNEIFDITDDDRAKKMIEHKDGIVDLLEVSRTEQPKIKKQDEPKKKKERKRKQRSISV